MLYKGLFSACVMYGSSVWCETMKYEYARVLINRCQRVVLCACLNVYRTVSTAALQILMGGLPWDLEYVRRGLKYRVRKGLSVNGYDVVNDDDLRGKDACESMELVERRLYETWRMRWDECTNGRVTYEFIKNVRFAECCVMFEPSLSMGYILTGHGSMNAFLYDRGLGESASCACGATSEDWEHVLVECPLYEDVRKLSEWGVTVRADGSVNVDDVLECKDRYERVCKFAACVFERRQMRGNV